MEDLAAVQTGEDLSRDLHGTEKLRGHDHPEGKIRLQFAEGAQDPDHAVDLGHGLLVEGVEAEGITFTCGQTENLTRERSFMSEI